MSTPLAPGAVRVEGDVAFIPLSKGYEAIIDAADVPLLGGRKWSALCSPQRKAVYACRVVVLNGKQQMLLLHRVLTGATKETHVDHVDGDGLNNRRNNLRLCSQRQNNWNVGLRADNKSGVKGVRFDTRCGRWRAEIGGQFIGYFDAKDDAAEAYARRAAERYGAFARRA